ncbi:MAG: type II toxin-antitoxin system VapC family toxin [Sphingobacteriaceae bacterium]|nr:MAG: type II toxin-antitoxin system VapC family toxin [Sphingobacteriaceae bacterium]
MLQQYKSSNMVVDTSIVIQHIRAKNKFSTTLYNLTEQEIIFISTVSMYELYIGAHSKDKQNDVRLSTKKLIVLPFTHSISVQAAEIFLQLKAKNQLIEFRDIFIAATCISHNLPIATLNKKHFERVEGLAIV